MQLRVTADALKREFGTYGNFYTLHLASISYPCRSVLEIIHHDITPLRLNDISSLQPDVVCVMMNPGGSRPQDAMYRANVINAVSSIGQYCNLVSTIPDITQFQIMRVLKLREWLHARILNLSDLREPQSFKFFQMLEHITSHDYAHPHSVFSDLRLADLGVLIPGPGIPILAGWGRDRNLKELARVALDKLSTRRIIGVRDPEDPLLFAHPSPMLQSMKDRWLDNITQQFADHDA